MKASTINLIFRQLAESEWSSVNVKSKRAVICNENVVAPDNSNFERVAISNDLKKEVNEEVLNDLIGFASVEINGGRLMDALRFDEVYLWYYHRFRIYYTIRESMYTIRTIEDHLNSGSVITAYTDDTYVQKYFLEHASIEIIPVQRKVGKPKISKLSLLWFGTRYAMRGFRHILRSSNFRKRKHLLLVNNDLLLQQKNGGLDYNPYYANLFNKGTTKDWSILRFNPFPKLENGLSDWNKEERVRSTGYSQLNSEFVMFFHGLRNYKQLKKINLFVRELANKKEERSASLAPVHRFFYDELVRLNSSSKLYLFQYVCFQSFLRKSQFKTITAVSEHSSNERSVLDAARSTGIKTLGIQHGSINEMNTSYIYGKDEKQYHPIPEQTFLWGENYQRVLLDHSIYTSENTKVFGQLRTDIIHAMSTSSEKIKIGGIDQNKPLVVFSTQPQKDDDLRSRAAKDVIEIAREFSEIQVVFKLHPSESKSYYQQFLNQTDRILLLKEEVDLYELLALNDVHITCFSTVGAEAIYFGKALIAIDYLDDDISNYKKNGVATQVRNRDELKSTVRELIQREFKPLHDTQDFIAKNTYKIDGKVAERYVQFIESQN